MERKNGTFTKERRPWGGFLILEDCPTHKVKRIWVNTGQRLSYQKHSKRSEHWIIVAGKAKVILDGKEILLKPGDSIDIPQGSAHRIGNIGEDLLSFIEIQRGDDFSEDDVVRLEDDYGRADPSSEVMLMKDEFVTGVNYWPIESAMNWWHRFDAGVVKEDFSRIQEAGLGVVRIFLLWEDFQPHPNKISVKVLNQLVTVMEIGDERRLKLMPTFFTGHMSGMNYLPPWMLELKESDDRFPVFSEGKKRRNVIRNFYTDREMMAAQKFLIREVSGALQGHPALWAWDLGNEPSNIVLPPSRNDALVWLEEMVSELKKRDESVPITLGLHQEDLEEDRKTGPKEVAAFCDFVSMHTYTIYAKWADGPLDEDVIPFLGLLTNWLGSKKVMIEEVGVPSSNLFKEADLTVSEDRAFEYYERLFPKLTRFGFLGVLFWSYGDYAKPLWDQAPFDEKKHERYFGLFHEDRSPKSFVPLLKSLQARKELRSTTFEWIDIEPEEYFQAPVRHLLRLYRRFKDGGLY